VFCKNRGRSPSDCHSASKGLIEDKDELYLSHLWGKRLDAGLPAGIIDLMNDQMPISYNLRFLTAEPEGV
jgi:hypothetical protein